MSNKVIKFEKDELYLEDTEDILKSFTKSDKLLILKLASDLNVNEFGDGFSKKYFRDLETMFQEPIKKMYYGLVEALTFYYNNPPKGYKRIAGSTDLCNEESKVIRFNRRYVSHYITDKGYIQVPIYNVITMVRGTRKTHRVIAETWIPNPKNKPQVNHIDTNKQNNKVDNLEWNTQIENMRHALDNGLRDTPAMKEVGNGEKNSQSKLNKVIVRNIRKTHKEKLIVKRLELMKIFNLSTQELSDVIDNKNKFKVKNPNIEKTVVSSRNPKKFFKTTVNYCKEPESYIRGQINSIIRKTTENLSETYNISLPTIRDIIARRSWNYSDC